eukprot:TRINITY_DN7953_c0_g1_i2.p1 TRINITY_DN7953_c0_g1~~TRINITY_DN7953_c0_g1_i2.p1  ORF type:complete len:220 (-),score=43.91 TRINITY_DN7953_c0_g1_i2:73-732(-)
MSHVSRKVVRSVDSPSLWNCTLSPGWKREDLEILRNALMKFGVGAWTKIVKSGCLPGKTPAQLNLQTQRILGQQSIGEFMGIHLDPNVIYEKNAKKSGVVRKNGCIINTGNNPTAKERAKKIQKNREKYGLPQEIIESIELEDRRTEHTQEIETNIKRNRLAMLKERLKVFEEKLAEIQLKNKQEDISDSDEEDVAEIKKKVEVRKGSFLGVTFDLRNL